MFQVRMCRALPRLTPNLDKPIMVLRCGFPARMLSQKNFEVMHDVHTPDSDRR